MREIRYDEIVAAVSELCRRANFELPVDVKRALQRARTSEPSIIGQEVLDNLLDNAALSGQGIAAICQDTGMVVVFVDLGQDVHIQGGLLTEAVNEGIRVAYASHPLRHSVVADPIKRTNTGSNTPAVIHLRLGPGNNLKLQIAPKGFGSENMSRLFMLKPAAGWPGVKTAVLQAVRDAGPNPCPPIIVGVGIGGTMEQAALLAKESLFRTIGSSHDDEAYAAREAELLSAINQTGIGPGGLGGRNTALAVHISAYPTHIAGLPVAVNLQCHACRHAEIVM